MSAFTLRFPDHKHDRLKALAAQQGMSLQRLMDDLATQALVEFDAETRFKIRAQRGSGQLERGLELLKKAAS
jgi:hypothetical protein